MIIVIGEILFDELPQGRRPGGAPFNLAQHLARMGCDVHFVSRVGTDEAGDELLKEVERVGLDPSFIQRDAEHPTGRVTVELDEQGIPTYDIKPDVAFDYIQYDGFEEACLTADLVYFGSLIQRTEHGRSALHQFLTDLPYGIIQFYDMNLRDGCERTEVVLASLEHTDVLKLNEEELESAGKLAGFDETGDALAEKLMETYSIRKIALTYGKDGSALYDARAKYEQEGAALSSDQIEDTVGAGDAFSSVLVRGLAQGRAPDTMLRDAAKLAEYICTISGAVPQDDRIYASLG